LSGRFNGLVVSRGTAPRRFGHSPESRSCAAANIMNDVGDTVETLFIVFSPRKF